MTTKKQPPGRWKKGCSGNPAGRPPGTGETAKLRAVIAERVPEPLAAMMDRAFVGDMAAARLLLERCIAPLKAVELPELLTLPAGGSLTDQGRAVLAAVAAGDLSTSQGAALLGAIANLARVAEIDDLAARVAALEGR